MAFSNYHLAYEGILGAKSSTSPEADWIVPLYDQDDQIMYRASVANIGSANSIRTLSSSDTLGSTDNIVLADATSAEITVTLPDSVSSGVSYTIKKVNSNANSVIVSAGESATLDGDQTKTLSGTALSSIKVVFDGTDWYIL